MYQSSFAPGSFSHEIDEENYAVIYEEGLDPPYETITEPYYETPKPIFHKITSKKVLGSAQEKEQNEKASKKRIKKEEKLKQKHEDRKRRISSPMPGSFVHTLHASFDSNGLLIEGMALSVVKDLIQQSGVSKNGIKKELPVDHYRSSPAFVEPAIFQNRLPLLPMLPSEPFHVTRAALKANETSGPSVPVQNFKPLTHLPVLPQPVYKPQVPQNKPIAKQSFQPVSSVLVPPQPMAKPYVTKDKPVVKPQVPPFKSVVKPQVPQNKPLVKPQVPNGKPALMVKPNKVTFVPKPKPMVAPPVPISTNPPMTNIHGSVLNNKIALKNSYQQKLEMSKKEEEVGEALRKAVFRRTLALQGDEDEPESDDEIYWTQKFSHDS